ncbi:MAG: hypothetical protein EXR81_02235 [Gammaproteobacteria bacterium]|nr:hypothetical protein [Gammaproteobacteria bacterium]
MLHWPNFDPVAFHLGSIAVHWYGLTYLVGFLLAWLCGNYRAHHFYYCLEFNWYQNDFWVEPATHPLSN